MAALEKPTHGRQHLCQALLCHARSPSRFSVYAFKLPSCRSSARGHGRKDVGLPSRLASFKPSSMPPAKRGKLSWWQQNHRAKAGLQGDGLASQENQQQDEHTKAAVGSIVVKNRERRHWAQPWRHNKEQMQQPVCTLHLPPALQGWNGPRLKLSLPSFRCVVFHLPTLLGCELCSAREHGNAVAPLPLSKRAGVHLASRVLVLAITAWFADWSAVQ